MSRTVSINRSRILLAKFTLKAVPDIPFIYDRFVVFFEIIGTPAKPLANDTFGDIVAALRDTPPYAFD
jgi:cyanate lyase